jgi:hypothetical protein
MKHIHPWSANAAQPPRPGARLREDGIDIAAVIATDSVKS